MVCWHAVAVFGMQRVVNVEEPEEPGLNEPGSNKKPRGRNEAIVQCDGYRCVGRMDTQGRWEDMKGRPLQVLKVVRWLW